MVRPPAIKKIHSHGGCRRIAGWPRASSGPWLPTWFQCRWTETEARPMSKHTLATTTAPISRSSRWVGSIQAKNNNAGGTRQRRARSEILDESPSISRPRGPNEWPRIRQDPHGSRKPALCLSGWQCPNERTPSPTLVGCDRRRRSAATGLPLSDRDWLAPARPHGQSRPFRRTIAVHSVGRDLRTTRGWSGKSLPPPAHGGMDDRSFLMTNRSSANVW